MIMKKTVKRFGIVSQTVITDPELSLQTKGIYSILCTYADKDRICYPSANTVADLANVSVRTVRRSIKELKEFNYLTRKGKYIILE